MMPPITLLCNYMDDDERRAFVDKMYEVKVHSEEVIMRQGAHALEVGRMHARTLHADVDAPVAQPAVRARASPCAPHFSRLTVRAACAAAAMQATRATTFI